MSGGRDSVVLLDLCANIRHQYPQLSLKAVHVNHGLQEAAARWALHCQSLCESYHIPLTILKVFAQSQRGQSPEEAARNARYQAFNDLLEPEDLLLMAHHQDDQAETLLLQLLRGAGLEGISGMPDSAPLGQGTLVRPLLDFDRAQILLYAETQRLHWVEDPSNRDARFDRNYLREHILPLIRARWPAMSRVLSRTARHAADAADHQRQQQRHLAGKTAPQGHFVLREAGLLHPFELRLAIRGWFEALGLRMPSERMTKTIIEELFDAGRDRTPRITLADGSHLVRYRGIVYRIPHFVPPVPCIWPDWRKALSLPGDNGTLTMTGCDSRYENHTPWDSAPIQVRYRSGGEKMQLSRREGHHALRDLFQERGIPPWIRERIPLIYVGDELAWVGHLWSNRAFFGGDSDPKGPCPIWIPPEGLDPLGALAR